MSELLLYISEMSPAFRYAVCMYIRPIIRKENKRTTTFI